MRYVYLKNGDAVAQVRRILSGSVDRSGPDAFIGDFLIRHRADSILVLCQTESPSRYDKGEVRAIALSIGALRVLHPLRRFLTALQVIWLITRERPDRIVCGMGGELLWAAAFVATVLRIPLVATRHSGLVDRAGIAGVSSALSRASFRTCVGVACHGPFLADQMREMGFRDERIFEFEVDLSAYGSGSDEGAIPIEYSQFAGQFQFIVLYAGRIQRNKGVFDILKAFCAAAAASETEMGLVFAGGGGDLGALRASAEACSAPHRVLFLGRVDHQALAQIMCVATISVCATRPPLLEGRCMAILESLVMGLPAVAPNFAAFPYAIRHEANGLLFEPGSPEDLERTLLRLTSNPALLHAIKTGAATSGAEIRCFNSSFAVAVERAFQAGEHRASAGMQVP